MLKETDGTFKIKDYLQGCGAELKEPQRKRQGHPGLRGPPGSQYQPQARQVSPNSITDAQCEAYHLEELSL